jgi:hypothetical protein
MEATGSLFPSASTLYLRVFGLLLLLFPMPAASSSSVLDKILRIHHHVPTNWMRQETSFSSWKLIENYKNVSINAIHFSTCLGNMEG